MKFSTLLALPFCAAVCFATAANAWTPHPLVRPTNTYLTRGFVCYGGTFAEIDSLTALPPALLMLIENGVEAESFGGPARGKGISDRGGPFNPTDVYRDSTPHLRFIVGALSSDVAMIAVEHGGIGYNKQMWTYLRTQTGWEDAPGAYLPGMTVKGSFQTRDEVLAQSSPIPPTDEPTIGHESVPDPHEDFSRFLALAKGSLGCKPGTGSRKIKTDKDLAAVLRDEAQRGDTAAQFALGHLYASGRGVSKDLAQAEAWYARAAASEADMQYDLGYDYANGIDLQQDYAAAMHWFRLSSSASDDSLKWLSYIQLGMLYADGKGVPVNKIAAYALFLSVPDYRFEPLTLRKDALEAEMSKDEIEKAQALRQEIYLESHEQGGVTGALDKFIAGGNTGQGPGPGLGH